VAGGPSRGSLWIPVLLYLALIFGLSSVAEVPALPMPGLVNDKVLHVTLYLGLGVLLTRALSNGFTRRVTVLTALLVAVCAMLYGISDEFHQSFVPPRQVDVFDLVADTIGGAIAGFGFYAWGIIRPRDGV
jgi:VanZ family protein